MSPKWLVEDFDSDDRYAVLAAEVVKQEMECVHVRYLPFQSGKYDHFDPNDCVIFYGSLNLARQLHRQTNWFVCCDLDNMRCQKYYSHWGQYVFNQDAYWIPVAELKRRVDEIYGRFGVDGCIFVRPDSGYKEFNGGIVKREDFHSECEWMLEFGGPSCLAVVASPKGVSEEFRFFCKAGQVLTGCRYKLGGNIDNSEYVDPYALAVANKVVCEQWQPDPLYVIDVCRSGNEYSLLELNSFSCSGIYLCDPAIIVQEATKMAIKHHEEVVGSFTGM